MQTVKTILKFQISVSGQFLYWAKHFQIFNMVLSLKDEYLSESNRHSKVFHIIS